MPAPTTNTAKHGRNHSRSVRGSSLVSERLSILPMPLPLGSYYNAARVPDDHSPPWMKCCKVQACKSTTRKRKNASPSPPSVVGGTIVDSPFTYRITSRTIIGDPTLQVSVTSRNNPAIQKSLLLGRRNAIEGRGDFSRSNAKTVLWQRNTPEQRIL